MLLKEFPDINWLKNAITDNFAEKRSWDNKPLPNTGWPTAILNVKTHHVERQDIKGPFSLFLNKSGSSEITCDKKTVSIHNDTYVVSNNEQHYDLLIDDRCSTETFNIHFGEKIFQDTVHSLSKNDEVLLADIKSSSIDFNLAIKSNFRTAMFNALVQKAEFSYGNEEKENSLYELLNYLLITGNKHLTQITNILNLKSSTKEELVRRIYLAVDFIHAHFTEPITLDQMAEVAMLSKFHFLRVFKSVFGLSPHQYIKHVRLQKATELIKQNKLPLYLIAQLVGIENGSSLSRMVYQLTGQRPSTIANS
ncbi:MAG: AraC family transcriptional regulator [Reichenbachiella sp.]|uniref:AraC family transcriptional regulator n=1 Tax=Reichenbachiella sp. TaxID=2184521 RepID=UPI003264C4A5